MNKCIDDFLLERYVIGDIADSQTIHKIERHIETCGWCRALVRELTDLHDHLSCVDSGSQSSFSRRLYHSLTGRSNSTCVTLHPIPEPASPAETRLAADTWGRPRFYKVSSFCDSSNTILARVMHDTEHDSLILYMVSSEPRDYTDYLLEVEGCNEKFLLDKTGRAVLKNVDRSFLKSRNLSLKSPLAVFELTPLVHKQICTQHNFRLKNKNLNEIQIDLIEKNARSHYNIKLVDVGAAAGTGRAHIVVARQGRSCLSAKAEQGVAVFETGDPENILKINIYS